MSHRRTPTLHLVVLASVVGALLLGLTASSRTPALHAQASSGSHASSQVPRINRATPPREKTYHHATYTMAAAFYDARGQWRSRLTLNNKGPEPKQPHVTLFSHDGRPFRVPGVPVAGNSFLDLDLNAIAAEAGPGFEYGSLRVAYYGDVLEMGAQVVIADLARGLQFDEQLSYTADGGSPRQEAVWWLPNARATFRMVLTNRSDEPIVVRARLRGAQPDRGAGEAAGRLDAIALRPNELRVVNLAAAVRDARGSVGGLSLEHDGPAGALLARGFVEDRRSGYSALVLFHDAAAARTTTLHGGGLRQEAAGTPLTPVVVARNAGDLPTTVTGRFVVTTGDEQVAVVPLPVTALEPQESVRMDTAEAWREAGRLGAAGIGVEFEYTTAPGSVVVSATMVGADQNHVFRVPLIDPETPASSTGGYPWRADGTTATVVYLKNTTTAPQTYLLQLSFPGGAYAPGLKTLQPGQTVALDIEALRDDQVPDAFGRTIPMDATGGQVHWSAKGPVRHAIVGRAEHADHAHGVSASYACVNCCPDNPWGWWTVDDPIVVPVGDWVDVYIHVQDQDCYGNPLEPYYLGGWWGHSWYVANTGIAYGDNNATITGVAAGSTTLHFTYGSEWWYPDVWEGGWFCNYDPYPLQYQTPVKVQTPTSLSVVSEQYTGAAGFIYEKKRVYQILDQEGQPMRGDTPGGLHVTESYTPNPPSGNCTTGQVETGSGYAFANGTFNDFYRLSGTPPNPCESTSTQKHFINGKQVSTYTVTWTRTGVTIQ